MNKTLDKRKFALIVARLASEHDGEVLAAARTATRLLREAGETWETALLGRPINRQGQAVYRGPATAAEAPGFVRPPLGMSLAEQMRYALARYESLSVSDKMLMTVFRTQADRGNILSPNNQRLLQEIVWRLKNDR